MRWLDIEEIAEALEKNYPKEDIVNLRFTSLHKWIISLEEFSDSPDKSNEKILEAIQVAWIEFRKDNS